MLVVIKLEYMVACNVHCVFCLVFFLVSYWIFLYRAIWIWINVNDRAQKKEAMLMSNNQCEAGMHTTPTVGFVHLPSHSTSKHTLKQKILSQTDFVIQIL